MDIAKKLIDPRGITPHVHWQVLNAL